MQDNVVLHVHAVNHFMRADILPFHSLTAYISLSYSNDSIQQRCTLYRKALELCNLWCYEFLDTCLRDIVKNVSERVKFERLAAHGPRKGALTMKSTLVESYFVRFDSPVCCFLCISFSLSPCFSYIVCMLWCGT